MNISHSGNGGLAIAASNKLSPYTCGVSGRNASKKLAEAGVQIPAPAIIE
ncbi:hypothetical protein MHH60_31965 [Paenibacillus sp. FSL H7-0716]|nr:hypothetical protein [Paenibacillus odorifer]